MHVLFVHPSYPGQFGHIAEHLQRLPGWRCTFVTAAAGGGGSVERVVYARHGGARAETHYCARSFENAVGHCDGAYRALAGRPELRPDLIVGHGGFGTTLFLRELWPDVPVVNLFEHWYHPHGPLSDIDFRKDLGWPVATKTYQRALCRNAMALLDLQNCALGYAPTEFQRSLFPREYDHKLRVVFDGIDRGVYHSHGDRLRARGRRKRVVGGVELAPRTRVVTYVSRGFESMRGFDVFVRVAQRIAREHGDVVFFVVGQDRVAYGGDAEHVGPSFARWAIERHRIDTSRMRFVGILPPEELALLLAASDLHVYLTVPFVLSWSMMDALSCGAVVLGSATAPVQEMIRHGENGLLADFFDVEGLAREALSVLRDPAAFRPLGRAAERLIAERYSLEAVLPQMLELYRDAARLVHA